MMPRAPDATNFVPLSRGWDPDMLDLRQVEQVVEVCRAGAITDAARNLQLTQPALSKSIARFERQLGVKLFERGGGSVRPTAYGRLIATRGAMLLGSAASVRQEIALMASGSSGRLRIGGGPASRIRPLKTLATQLAARYPLLRLEIREEGADGLMQGMAEGRYDIVFGYYESAQPFGELIRVKVLEDQRVAVVRPGHPVLDLGRPLAPRDMLRFPIASAGAIPAFRDWTGTLSPDEIRNATAILCEDYDIIAGCAASSDVIAWGPRFAFEAALATGSLIEAPITWLAKYECWMLTTETHWRLPIVREVADLAKSIGRAAQAVSRVAASGGPSGQGPD